MATNQKVGGSSPSWRATSRRTLVVRRIFLRKMRLHRTGCRSSPRKVTLGSAARLQAPSLTPRCRYQLFAVEGHCSLGIYFVTLTQRPAAAPKSRSSLLWWSRFLLPAFFIGIYFITLTHQAAPGRNSRTRRSFFFYPAARAFTLCEFRPSETRPSKSNVSET